jgi:hypothetical protein
MAAVTPTTAPVQELVQVAADGAVTTHGPADIPAAELPDGWAWVEIPLD